MQRRALTSSSESRGFTTPAADPHFGSGLTINIAAGLYEKGMIVLTRNERY